MNSPPADLNATQAAGTQAAITQTPSKQATDAQAIDAEAVHVNAKNVRLGETLSTNLNPAFKPSFTHMVKGLAITPPVIGRISIGHMVERNGKRLPEKDDSFTITTQVQSRDGWLLHPLHQQLLAPANEPSKTEVGLGVNNPEQTNNAANPNKPDNPTKSAPVSIHTKLRTIPVHVLFNDSDLNLRAQYSAFDRQTGRPLCVGNGEQAKRHTPHGMETVMCVGTDNCEFGHKQGCKLYGRLNVQIDGQNDALGSFIFRTTGYNSVRTLSARLKYFEAVSGGNTQYLPLMLKLRAKSTTLSHRAPVYYVDITLRDQTTLGEAVQIAHSESSKAKAQGINHEALETAAHALFANGAFEDTADDTPLILDEHYAAASDEVDVVEGQQIASSTQNQMLVNNASNGTGLDSNPIKPIQSAKPMNSTIVQARRLSAKRPT